MVLKGPELQLRIFGTPAAYVSSDLDLLVRRSDAEAVRRHLIRDGWVPDPTNSLLWPLSAEATYEKAGVRLDLHWGLHAAHLPTWTFRQLEGELWKGAVEGVGGLLEPRAEPLVVYLAVHAAGHGFARPEWTECVVAAGDLVGDWGEVWRIAEECGVAGALGTALAGGEGKAGWVLDGPRGRLEWGLWWIVRGRFLPSTVREWAREERTLAKEGFGWRARGGTTIDVGDRSIERWRGVCGPGDWTPALVDAWLAAPEADTPTFVEIGVGTGVLTFLGARRRPDARFIGTDISNRAWRNAVSNVRRLGLPNVRFYLGDMFRPVPDELLGRVDAILAHLPSVAANAAARFTRPIAIPRATLVGPDPDGLGLIRRLMREARPWLAPKGSLIVSMQDWQWRSLESLASSYGYLADPVVPQDESGVIVRLIWQGNP